jgi:hypothetical protein
MFLVSDKVLEIVVDAEAAQLLVVGNIPGAM